MAAVIPEGQLVYGMQLPIQSQSTRYAEDWEPGTGIDELTAIARACDESGFFYVAVCDHVAIPRPYDEAMRTSVLAFSRALGEFGATVMIAGNIPGKTRTLALAIFHDNQIGRDDRALALCGVTVVLAFAALWLAEWVTRRRSPAA